MVGRPMVDAFNPSEHVIDAAVNAFREAMPPGAQWVLSIRSDVGIGYAWQEQTCSAADMLVEASARLSVMAQCTAAAAGIPEEEVTAIGMAMVRQMNEHGTIASMRELANRLTDEAKGNG